MHIETEPHEPTNQTLEESKIELQININLMYRYTQLKDSLNIDVVMLNTSRIIFL